MEAMKQWIALQNQRKKCVLYGIVIYKGGKQPHPSDLKKLGCKPSESLSPKKVLFCLNRTLKMLIVSITPFQHCNYTCTYLQWQLMGPHYQQAGFNVQQIEIQVRTKTLCESFNNLTILWTIHTTFYNKSTSYNRKQQI